MKGARKRKGKIAPTQEGEQEPVINDGKQEIEEPSSILYDTWDFGLPWTEEEVVCALHESIFSALLTHIRAKTPKHLINKDSNLVYIMLERSH